jgi:putative transposase
LEVRVKKKRLTEEQIAYALAQESSGQTIPEICRRLGMSEQTFCRWKKKLGSKGVADV